MKLTFHRRQLIEQVQKNEERYLAALQRANEGWRIAVRRWLTGQVLALEDLAFHELPIPFNHDRVAMVQATEDARLALITCPHQPPPDHRVDYHRVLEMLRNAAEDVITLSDDEYQTYVLDRWKWKVRFDPVVTRYAAMLPDSPILGEPLATLELLPATAAKIETLGILAVGDLVACAEEDLVHFSQLRSHPHSPLTAITTADLAEIKERLAAHHLSLHPRRPTTPSV